MRRVALLLLICLIAGSLYAQETKTLWKKGKTSGGWQAGPAIKLGLINGEFGVISGVRAAWLINHSYSIGGGAYFTTSDSKFDYDDPTQDDPVIHDININYFVGEFEYLFRPNSLYHVSGTILFGGGDVRIADLNNTREATHVGVLIAEPVLGCEMNFTTWMRWGLALGYRFAYGMDSHDLKDEDISGPAATLTLKLGVF